MVFDYGGICATLTAGEAVRRLSSIALISDQLTTKFKHTAVIRHDRTLGILLNIYSCIIFIQGLSQGEAPGHVKAMVCNRADIPAQQAYVGMQKVKAGGNTSSFYLVNHLFQVFPAIGILRSVVVISIQAVPVLLLKYT